MKSKLITITLIGTFAGQLYFNPAVYATEVAFAEQSTYVDAASKLVKSGLDAAKQGYDQMAPVVKKGVGQAASKTAEYAQMAAKVIQAVTTKAIDSLPSAEQVAQYLPSKKTVIDGAYAVGKAVQGSVEVTGNWIKDNPKATLVSLGVLGTVYLGKTLYNRDICNVLHDQAMKAWDNIRGNSGKIASGLALFGLTGLSYWAYQKAGSFRGIPYILMSDLKA